MAFQKFKVDCFHPQAIQQLVDAFNGKTPSMVKRGGKTKDVAGFTEGAISQLKAELGSSIPVDKITDYSVAWFTVDISELDPSDPMDTLKLKIRTVRQIAPVSGGWSHNSITLTQEEAYYYSTLIGAAPQLAIVGYVIISSSDVEALNITEGETMAFSSDRAAEIISRQVTFNEVKYGCGYEVYIETPAGDLDMGSCAVNLGGVTLYCQNIAVPMLTAGSIQAGGVDVTAYQSMVTYYTADGGRIQFHVEIPVLE